MNRKSEFGSYLTQKPLLRPTETDPNAIMASRCTRAATLITGTLHAKPNGRKHEPAIPFHLKLGNFITISVFVLPPSFGQHSSALMLQTATVIDLEKMRSNADAGCDDRRPRSSKEFGIFFVQSSLCGFRWGKQFEAPFGKGSEIQTARWQSPSRRHGVRDYPMDGP